MNQGLKNIFILIGLALLAYFLWYIREIIAYVAIAVVVALICRPLVNLIKQAKIGNWSVPSSLAAIVSLVVFLGVIIGIVLAFVPMVAAQMKELSSIEVKQIITALEQPLNDFSQFLARYQINPESLKIDELKQKMATYINPNTLSQVFSGVSGWFSNLFVGGFAIIFIAFFMLKEANLINRMILGATPDKYIEEAKEVMGTSKKLLSRYFIGLMVQVAVFTGLITLGMSLLGMKNALLIGFFAGLVNLIPYLGPFIGAAFALAISVSSNLDLDFYSELSPKLVLVVVIFAVTQMIDNFVAHPLIFSKSVKMHPLEVFLVVLIAGTIAGIPGMVLAIPFYTLFRVIAKEFLGTFKIVKSLTKDI